MRTAIAALPMYEWPETRAATDAEWTRFCAFFQRAGIDAPKTIVRRNAEMPAVPGGIRDRDGNVIAPDPASLPPDEFDFQTLWRHPDLLLAQTCWGPMELGLAEHVRRGRPAQLQGVRRRAGAALFERDIDAAERGARCTALQTAARSSRSSASATNASPTTVSIPCPASSRRRATSRRWARASTSSRERIETGAHRASIVAVAEGRADVCAIDCRSWHMAKRHEPKAAELEVVGWTGLRKGLPMITSRHTPEEIVEPADRDPQPTLRLNRQAGERRAGSSTVSRCRSP